jgi:hypothetical protein
MLPVHACVPPFTLGAVGGILLVGLLLLLLSLTIQIVRAAVGASFPSAGCEHGGAHADEHVVWPVASARRGAGSPYAARRRDIPTRAAETRLDGPSHLPAGLHLWHWPKRIEPPRTVLQGALIAMCRIRVLWCCLHASLALAPSHCTKYLWRITWPAGTNGRWYREHEKGVVGGLQTTAATKSAITRHLLRLRAMVNAA